MKKVFAIGDIHGEFDRLVKMVDHANSVNADTIIFTGDVCDRGMKSMECYDFLMTIPNAKFCMGNHDEFMLDSPAGSQSYKYWSKSYGENTVKSYGNRFDIYEKHRQFIKNDFVNYIIVGSHLFVHAGINPHYRLKDNTSEDFLWIRDTFLNYPFPMEYFVVHGHTPEEKRNHHVRYSLDSGCGKHPNLPLVGALFEIDEVNVIEVSQENIDKGLFLPTMEFQT